MSFCFFSINWTEDLLGLRSGLGAVNKRKMCACIESRGNILIRQTGRSDSIIRFMRMACWIPKATDVHSEYVIILLFHCNNGCTKAPECYVVRTAHFLSFFYFCWPCISVYLSQYLTNLMHKICFTIRFISCLYMFRAHVLIIRRSKLHYTASGIITPKAV